ncbi:hypothetical protein [Actinoplanes couchii]|uniref:Uncharacterized protein n=1 Tax=Actinoplanes couchii TaxID=403638 RepID=A0ABQ3XJE7_9ACTN|nr:hypothetical protein [Actinoplanes couchii]MDR6324387.1 hypothetical protein [Actinoplanes couchii]GID58613.1 hypothetical protein Aco03nite_070170 [Actinoplanes couchii]
MRFGEHYEIIRSEADDWFDPYLATDTPLCVEPFAIWADTDDLWFGAHDHVLDFFAMVFDLVRESGGNTASLAWKKAQALMLFPEPAEFCLGVAAGSPNGNGAGKILQEGMLEGVRTALGLGFDNVPHMEMLALFQGGMGLDRISDAVCNIAKSFFITYTQQVARRHNVPTETFRVRNATWDAAAAMWRDAEVDLPVNPYTSRRTPVLLVPKRFLRDIPVVTADGFWRFAWNGHAEELRTHFNYDIARHVDRREKAKLARQNPAIVAEYLTSLEHEDHPPYDVDKDPKLRTSWWERGGAIAATATTSFVPEDPAQFPDFVGTVIDVFKRGIEREGEWQQLWHNNFAYPEKKVQMVFRACVKHYCKANDVAIAGEANAGRGPVDFEFARGWMARSVVELKLVSNTRFWDGILAQTPEYAMAADVNIAYFVAVAFTDAEMADSFTAKVAKAARIASELHNVEVRAVIVDARQRPSASKLKPPQEVRDELHRPDEDAAA